MSDVLYSFLESKRGKMVRKKEPLTLDALKTILNSIPEEYKDATIIVESHLLDRDVPMVVGDITLTNVCDVLEMEYWCMSSDEEQLKHDLLLPKYKNKKVIHIEAFKCPAGEIIT